jgi:hypothetical protein
LFSSNECRLEYDYHKLCNGSPEDKVANLAALLVVQRSDDYVMIPGYDLYNHRNGKYHNTDMRWDRDEPHETKASRNIKKGEQIYNSYNLCEECEARTHEYGAGGKASLFFPERLPPTTCNLTRFP